MTKLRMTLFQHRVTLVTALMVIVASSLTTFLVWSEVRTGEVPVNWLPFVVIAVLLVICERTPATWIRVGSAGIVTPLWLFTFGLMLVGPSSVAVCVALLGTTLRGLSQSEMVTRFVFRIGGTAVSLSSGAIVLRTLGVQGSIMQHDSLPWNWALALVATGATIVLLNSAVAAIWMSTQRRISFFALLQRGLRVRITAEGAFLALAPIWVIGVDFGVMLVPLLGITTVLVFRSTRQALERSHEAHHDSLTGLLNRRSFLDNVEVALTESHASVNPTVLIMDLDGFKDINDRLGHQLGDSLLVAFADRLAHNLPPDSSASRLGGDEFAVLLSGLMDAEEVGDNVNKLHAALSRPLTVEEFPMSIAVSIGVAMAPADGRTPRDLMRSADVAMYRAKRTGSAVEHHANCIKSPQRGRLNLLSDLSDALEDHQLHIHFQPQLRMSDGEVDTVEALIRWQHPEHGSIPPSEFIGLAEQTDLIVPITEMVLRVATGGLVTGAGNANIAVNVSPRSLQDPDFASQVLEILEQADFPPHRLELEVTERSIVSNAERCSYTIGQLRAAGVRVAIDDFGIGYSSFQALRILQVDRVKIDRDFVQGILTQPRDRLIVQSVIELAHELDLDVVAEGVETTELWDALADLGCDVAQGYGIAMPMAFPELRTWLSDWDEILVERVGSSTAV